MAERRYDSETFEDILNRMLARLPDDIDKREGSVVYDLLAPAAAELAQSYIELQNVLDFGFAETSYGEYLDYRATELGLARKAATTATGFVTFTGKPGEVVPFGTRVSTNHIDPTYFTTYFDLTLDSNGTGTVEVVAVETGIEGNVAANKVTIVLGDLSGTVTVTNAEGFSGGTEEESDEDLLERYLERIQRPIASGNVNDYVSWAKEVEGVGEVKCFPLWNGNGTVKIVITDANKRTPNQEIIDNCLAHIELERPVGASVTVTGAVEVPIGISVKLYLENSKTLADAQAEIEESVGYYFSQIAFEDNIVRYNYIAALILQCASVLDYENLTVNGLDEVNVTLTDEQIPVFGAVTLS